MNQLNQEFDYSVYT